MHDLFRVQILQSLSDLQAQFVDPEGWKLSNVLEFVLQSAFGAVFGEEEIFLPIVLFDEETFVNAHEVLVGQFPCLGFPHDSVRKVLDDFFANLFDGDYAIVLSIPEFLDEAGDSLPQVFLLFKASLKVFLGEKAKAGVDVSLLVHYDWDCK